MTEENNAQVAAEQPAVATPTPDTPAVAETSPTQEATPQTSESAPEETASAPEKTAEETPKAEVQRTMKITVSAHPPKKGNKPHREGSFPPNDAAAKKAWIANKHKEQQEQLIKNGYSPSTTLSIMRYLTSNHGYEKQRAKDHLIYMFERLARSMKYSLDRFDRDMSSLLAIMLIDINAHLNEEKKLFDLPDEESMKYVTDVFNKVWKSGGGNDAGREMQNLKLHFLKCMNVKVAEGYARRCKYFLECIIDISMKMSDPFEGLFHTERLEIPDEMREIMHMKPKGQRPPKKEWPKVFCEKCGGEMRWVPPFKKHVCNNPLCTEYVPKPDFKNRGKGRPQRDGDAPRGPHHFNKKHEGGYDSGKPITQKSASDKFRQKYANRPPRPERTIASTGPTKTITDKDGIQMTVRKDFQKDANPFAALDALKPAEPATAAQTTENLPPPPAEQPVV